MLQEAVKTAPRSTSGGADGTLLKLDVLSTSQLWRLSMGLSTAFITFVLVGYSNGPEVSQKSWTGHAMKCIDGFNQQAFNLCNTQHTTHAWWEGNSVKNGFDVADQLQGIPNEAERQTVLKCLFDSCDGKIQGRLEHSVHSQGVSAIQDEEIEVMHYTIPVHSMSPKHRYMYLEAEFPNEYYKKKDHSFAVSVNPTVMGHNPTEGMSESDASLVPASSHGTVMVQCPKSHLYCDPVPLVRLGNVAYSDYTFDVLLNSTVSAYEDEAMNPQGQVVHTSNGLPLKGQDAVFYITFGSQAFTNWLMTFKTLFFLTSLAVAIWAVRKHRSVSDYARHLEQNWITLLAIALVGFNDPFYLMESRFVTNDVLKVLAVGFQVSYFCLLCLFWLIMLDHIRLSGREGGRVHHLAFYLPKVVFVGIFWLFTLLAFAYSKYQDDNDPTWDPAVEFAGFLPCAVIASVMLIAYLGWLILSLVRASKAISALSVRYRYFVHLSGGVIFIALIGLSVGAYAPIPVNAGEWTGFYALFNFYTFVLVYLYSPASVTTTRAETRALSSSDEVVLSEVKVSTEEEVV